MKNAVSPHSLGNGCNNTILLRLPEVEKVTGLKKSKIYADVKIGKFPTPLRLGPKSVAWRSDEVYQWVYDRPRAIDLVEGEGAK